MGQLTKDLFLSEEEIEKLMKSLDLKDPNHVLMLFLLSTGARISEAIAVKWSDISFDQGTVYLTGLKQSNDRILPISEELLSALKDLKLIREKPFPITRQGASKAWNKIRPVRKKLHSLRHTFGVTAYKSFKDIHLVKTALGHRSIENTMIYLSFVEAEEELEKLRDMYIKKGQITHKK